VSPFIWPGLYNDCWCCTMTGCAFGDDEDDVDDVVKFRLEKFMAIMLLTLLEPPFECDCEEGGGGGVLPIMSKPESPDIFVDCCRYL
jgi:hypothetical protein